MHAPARCYGFTGTDPVMCFSSASASLPVNPLRFIDSANGPCTVATISTRPSTLIAMRWPPIAAVPSWMRWCASGR
ncbi:hypothetical protein G6F64_015318 [Rhizopus arrhizus]|uniref:Uncharacterized protein n=1 Tax=Rhizopus oryzae TaxID=64495 RepID=A0A9P7BIY6_RHIOR|nr:hypothetical protein G6F64_015318 [Rhizopus arrhizus]